MPFFRTANVALKPYVLQLSDNTMVHSGPRGNEAEELWIILQLALSSSPVRAKRNGKWFHFRDLPTWNDNTEHQHQLLKNSLNKIFSKHAFATFIVPLVDSITCGSSSSRLDHRSHE